LLDQCFAKLKRLLEVHERSLLETSKHCRLTARLSPEAASNIACTRPPQEHGGG